MTSRQQRDSAQLTLAREVGFVRKPHANRLRVALAFPNTYFVGMSNLGFQTVYRLFNDHPDVVCERVFLPPKQELESLLQSGARLVTLESQTPVNEFDVLAFSVSFEWDYTNVLTMLRLADLPLRAADRDYRMPLVVIGGAVTFVNPEPLALFADVIAAGEGESLVPSLVEACGTPSRSETLRRLAPQRGFYIPSFYDVDYDADGTIARLRAAGWHRRAGHREEGRAQDHGRVRPAGDEHLHARHRVRVALPRRGGSRLRQPVPVLLGRLQLPAGPRVPDRADPGAGTAGAPPRQPRRAWSPSRSAITPTSSTSCAAWAMGYSICPASLRLDDLTPTIVTLLRESGERTLTIAPETGSDRLRRVINKTVTNDEILRRRGAHLLERHREPEALLHDRPADRGRRRSGGDPRPDRAAAGHHGEARPSPRPHRPHRRQRESARAQAGHGVPVAADGRDAA